MAKGGRREGAGRKKGSGNKPRLKLTAQSEVAAKPKPPTMAELREKVATLSVLLTEEQIAVVMGMGLEKLREVFAHELLHGPDYVRAVAVLGLREAAVGGSVGAQKALLALTEPVDDDAPGSDSAPVRVTAEYQSKKLLAKERAHQVVAAGGPFAPSAPPMRVVGGTDLLSRLEEPAPQ